MLPTTPLCGGGLRVPGLLYRHRSWQSGDFYLLVAWGELWQVPYLASHRLVKQNLRGALPLRTPAPNAK